jgi:DNA repair exonuclease SbcCD nuclease subunit
VKYIFIADLHLSAFSSESMVEGLPEKLYYKIKVLENILSENDVENIMILGDIFHTKSIIHSIALNTFAKFLEKNKDRNFIMLNGNHDSSSRTGDGVSALKSLEWIPNVTVMYDAKAIDDILLVPWNPKNMLETIKVNSGKCRYLASHFGLNEASLSNGISIVSDIGLKDLISYDKVFLGHYHSPQSVGNVTYIGSVIQEDWGEKNEEKRYIIFDTETGEHQSIPTKGYKKHIELDLSKNNKFDVVQKAKELLEEGNIVRMKTTEVMDMSDTDIQCRVISEVQEDITNRGLTTSMSLKDKMKKYLEIRNIPEELHDIYLEIGISIVNDIHDSEVSKDEEC